MVSLLRCKIVPKAVNVRLKMPGNSTWTNNQTTQHIVERRLKLRKLANEYLGGECIICGFNEYDAALDCHHVDPKTKKFSIARLLSDTSPKKSDAMKRLFKELDKCVLLCANCHRAYHAGEIQTLGDSNDDSIPTQDSEQGE